jgi:acetyltransferase-like isoleucine patch superfamily enzyme
MTSPREVVGTLTAAIYRARFRGRMRGRRFILRTPSLLRIHKGATVSIGVDTLIDKDARIVVRRQLSLGDSTFIGKNSTLIAFADLSIGDRVLLGENVSIHTEDHGPPGSRDDYSTASVSIGDDVWIGAGVVITKGVTIGEGATVGANAVVTKDIPSGATAVGIPARVIR